MNTKTIITIIVIFLVVLLGGVGIFFYITSSQAPSVNEPRESFFETIFPFGSESTPFEETENEEVVVEETVEGDIPALRLISREPVSGAVILSGEKGEVVRYVERGTGHIMDTLLDGLEVSRVSNNTIPRVQNVEFSEDGSVVVYQYENEQGDLQSFMALLEESTENALSGEFLEENLRNISFEGTNLFYQKETLDETSFIRGSQEGVGLQEVFSIPFTNFTADWFGRRSAYVTERPSAAALGSSFYLSTSAGTLSRVLGPKLGLTTLSSPDGSLLLFSETTETGPSLKFFDTDKNKETDLSLKSLPEKCVWENNSVVYCSIPFAFPGGSFPDDWYKGVISFTDDIWKINVEALQATRLLDLYETAREDIDGIKLSLSPSGDFLVFINKRNGSLWSLDLREGE